ncbi:MAG: hypothetical protein COU29_02805 [Candidatus Magasanikbacteria bacterium CG10_big_fil_rev_8_21_14_0_10_36_32]|uniref:Zinc ribbon domain-containing protein n=1 Tax=Candidatus Magasanikbacteria bacterium CG10_big_fil_rev_8_21_14_0_10_36_32 TaxID=1974646 RepID=A0A2M6W789_9BACT|nr:MAG: hypothetical protein COU29_02805 [Candidatus Magasanikbacteria bacterium CG10_big_fil_rev_8_21_14_0_10_36_32]
MFILLWLFCGITAATIGAKKGEGLLSFVIAFFFGPFGIVFAILCKGNRKNCPYCKELINKEATRCPRCQREQ